MIMTIISSLYNLMVMIVISVHLIILVIELKLILLDLNPNKINKIDLDKRILTRINRIINKVVIVR